MATRERQRLALSLTPAVRERLERHAALVGLAPSTFAAYLIGDATAKADAVMASMPEMVGLAARSALGAEGDSDDCE